MNNPTQKRRNPFDSLINDETPTEKVTPEPFSQPETVKPQKQNTFQPKKPEPQPVKQTSYQENLSEREKYTSTMAKSLRKKIKIACVNKGILFAQFVEEACREKLEREGMM